MFRGTSEARAKGAALFSAEVAHGNSAWRDWWARLKPAHCHPWNRMERYRGARRLMSFRAMLPSLRTFYSTALKLDSGFSGAGFSLFHSK